MLFHYKRSSRTVHACLANIHIFAKSDPSKITIMVITSIRITDKHTWGVFKHMVTIPGPRRYTVESINIRLINIMQS